MKTLCLIYLSPAGGAWTLFLAHKQGATLVNTHTWYFWPMIPCTVCFTGDSHVAPRKALALNPMGGGGQWYFTHVFSLFFGSLGWRDYNAEKGTGTRLKKTERGALRGPHPWDQPPTIPSAMSRKQSDTRR